MLIKRQRLTDPDVEPITLEEAKAHLRVDHDDEDALITAMIGAAREYCENYCNRAFAVSTWLYLVDRLPRLDDAMWLPDPSITEITSITYVDNDGDAIALNELDFSLDAPRQELRATEDWPTYTSQVAITYTASPASVPKSVKAAMLLVLTDLYEIRAATITGTIVAENPAVAYLLNPHRVEMGM